MPDDPTTAVVRSALETAARNTDPAGRELDTRDPATVDTLMAFLDQGVEFHEDPRFPEADVYHGIHDVTRYWTQFSDNFDRFTFLLEDVVPAGPERALVLFLIRAQGRGSDAVGETRSAWLVTVADGRAVTIHAFLDREAAFEFEQRA